MPTTTSNYSLLKPLVNNATDQDLWGGYLNDDMDDIDALLKQGITATNQSVQTGAFVAVATISTKCLYPCDSSGGAFAVTLPSAASAGNGAMVFFKKEGSGTNAVTITRAGSDTIDGANTVPITSQYSILGLVSDGTSKWRILIPLSASVFTGDSGSGGTAGLVPAPTAGYAAQKRVLGAGGSWVRTPLHAKYTYQLTSGTNGGTPTAGSWTDRPINTEEYDEIGISLSSNGITLPVGTYFMSATMIFGATDGGFNPVKGRARNTTDGTDAGYFMSGVAPVAGSTATSNYILCMNRAKVVVSGAPKVFKIQYYSTTARANTGLGQPYSAPGQPEIYAEWIVEQVD